MWLIEKIKSGILKLKTKPSFKLIFFLAFLGYVGYVNAHNLFYMPKEGKPIDISSSSGGSEQSSYQIRLFEKVSVIEPRVKINIERSGTELPSYIPPELSRIETTTSPTIETPSVKSTPSQASSFINTQQKSALKESSSKETITAIQAHEVAQVLNKFGLQKLKDGSVLELHISESRGEVFTIYIRNGFPDVVEGETSNEDVLIWISRKGFLELQKSNDITTTIKALAGEGQISLTQKTNTWTLWRKGYKRFAERLGLM
ncbi:hypothetical protein [Candidatus Pyrohabitans sp.]